MFDVVLLIFINIFINGNLKPSTGWRNQKEKIFLTLPFIVLKKKKKKSELKRRKVNFLSIF